MILYGRVLICLLLAGCAATTPQSNVPVDPAALQIAPGPGPYTFDCDAPAGQFQEMNAAVPSNKVRVTGLVQLLAVRSNAAWVPAVSVTFAGARKLPKVGLQALVDNIAPTTLQVSIRGTGGAQERTVFASMPLTTAQIPFTLALGNSGRVDVTVGSAAASLSVGTFDLTRLNLFCSTAHVRFSNVAVVEN